MHTSRFFPVCFADRSVRLSLALLVLLIGVLGSLQSASAQEEDASLGLNGIIGEPPSPELDTQFLAMDLPESWKAWAEALDEEMLVYLFPEELDVKEQRELIAKLRQRVAAMEMAIRDPRYRPIRDRLISLAGPLDRHLDLSTAILDALDAGVVPVSDETKQQAFVHFQEAAKSLESTLANRPDAEEWNKLLELPRLLAVIADRNTPGEELRKLLEEILSQVEDEETLTADQLRFLRSDAFWPFQKSAARIRTILEWEESPAKLETLRETLTDLAVAVVSLDVNHLVSHAKDLQLAWDRLVLLNPSNAERFVFLNEQYYSDNLYTFISEQLMKEIVYDRRTDSGQICETVMGARVYGNQVTNTEVTVDLVPSPEEALLAVRLAGDIRANTVGVKCQIKVYTQAGSQFLALKHVHFNGYRFQPYPAEIGVNVNTMPYDAETPISCLPLLGNCVDNLVLNQAISRKGDAEAMARQRVADRVVPELNQGINDALAEANSELTNNIYRRLRNNNLYPVEMNTATTETHFLSETLIRNRVELGGGSPPSIFDEPTGLNIHVHETLLNNIADRMNLAGRTMTDKEVRDEITRFVFELTGRTIDLSDPERDAEPTTEPPDRFMFDKITPLRFQIKNNEVQMTVRTALLRSNGEVIPSHDIMIPLFFEFEGEDLLIKKGRLAVNRSDGQGNPAQNLVMGKKIGDSIPDGRRSRRITLKLQEEKTLTLRLEQIKALNGWLSVWAIPVEAEALANGAPMNDQIPMTNDQ